MPEAYVVDACRTAYGKRGGSFRDLHPQDLATYPLKALVERNGLRPEALDDCLLGCVSPVGEQGLNIARMATLNAGFGIVVPGVTLNRMCGSGQQAVNFAATMVKSGDYGLVLAGGVEHMTRVPIGSDAGPVSPRLEEKHEILHQGESAERIADQWGFTREDLDRFAAESQWRQARAMEEGRLKREIVPVEVELDGEKRWVEQDEHPRPGTTVEKLAGLKPVFRPDHGRITAGNSSGIVDGAAAVLVAGEKAVREHGFAPRARIVAQAVVGSDPALMLTGPIPATRKVLEKAGLAIDDVDVFECNEAFASVPLAWMKDTGAPADKVNVNGGAIARGHPLGATGAGLLTTALHELERTGKSRALVTMCIGFGQGIATVLERV